MVSNASEGCMIEKAPISKFMTYEESILYCKFLEYDGHQDWRMPTKKEYDNYIGAWSWSEDSPTTAAYGRDFRLPVVPVRDI